MTDLQSNPQALLKRIRILLILFIAGLIISGLTAFALEYEMSALSVWLPQPDAAQAGTYADFHAWILRIKAGLHATNENYPFIAYVLTGWPLPIWCWRCCSSGRIAIPSATNG